MSLKNSDHDYYCRTERWAGDGRVYGSWGEFLKDWGACDMDLNLLFRWDWVPLGVVDPPPDSGPDNRGYETGDALRLFWILQRKGEYRWCTVEVTDDDEERVRAWLQLRFDYLKELWLPLI